VVKTRPVEILLVENADCGDSWLRQAFHAGGLEHAVKRIPSTPSPLTLLRESIDPQSAADPALILLNVSHAGSGSSGISASLELLSDIKSDPELRSIPVVVVTDTRDEADILNAYSHGACSFVCNPGSTPAQHLLAARFADYWGWIASLPRQSTDSTLHDVPASSDPCASHPTRSAPVDILVVDDSEDDVLLLHEAFEGCPLVRFVGTVDDGEMALRYLRGEAPFVGAKRPGLVLLDINMPGMNGFEVLTAMRADPRLARVPTVMLTTSRLESDVLRAYTCGACSYISKPVSFDRMRQIARQFAVYWSLVADLPDSTRVLSN